ncbi:MAG: hypothetical protein LBC86_09660 [Oscillospiraceae bacterium]|nr:hypothetical protein [Oscillospiraceae bacterium]
MFSVTIVGIGINVVGCTSVFSLKAVCAPANFRLDGFNAFSIKSSTNFLGIHLHVWQSFGSGLFVSLGTESYSRQVGESRELIFRPKELADLGDEAIFFYR